MGGSKAWIGVWSGVCGCSDRIVADGDDGADTGGSPTSSADDGVDDFGDDRPGDASDGELEEGEAEVDEGMQREERQALVAVATFLSTSTPLQWHMVSEWEGDEVVEVRLQSLSLDVGSVTSPRELVGDQFAVDAAADDTGQIILAIEDLFVPGVANPITGSDVVGSDVRMNGFVQLDGTACGVVMGTIILPIESSLGGSTFAITPIESLDALPDVVVAGC